MSRDGGREENTSNLDVAIAFNAHNMPGYTAIAPRASSIVTPYCSAASVRPALRASGHGALSPGPRTVPDAKLLRSFQLATCYHALVNSTLCSRRTALGYERTAWAKGGS